MATKTISILGGTGFIGRALAARLSSAGYLVRVPTRKSANARRLRVLPNVSVQVTDIHDGAALAAHIAGSDAVVNLVGILNESGATGSFNRAHAELAEKLVNACTESGTTRLIQISALKASAEGPSEYLKSKARAEEFIRAATLEHTILQPSVVFGDEDSFTNRFAALLKLSPLLPLARPNARFAPVWVGDVVSVIERAIADETMIGQTYQLCGPKIYSLRELVDFIRDTSGLDGVTVGLPDSLAKLQGRIMEWLPGKPFTLDNYRSLTVHSICDVNGFKTLGMTPRSLEAEAPAWLAAVSHGARLSDYRRDAGR